MNYQLIGPSSRPYIAGLSSRQLHRLYATTREAPAVAAANVQKSDAATDVANADKEVARAPSQEAALSSNTVSWMQKQVDQMALLETRKQKPPIKASQDMPFAIYVPPQKPKYGLFELEKWAIFYWGRFNNWRQSSLAGGELWGGFWANLFRLKSGTQRKVIQEELIPLYKRLCTAQAAGDIQRLEEQLSASLYTSLRAEVDKRRHRGLSARWKWHGVNNVTQLTTRLMEQGDRSRLLQTVLRLDTQQSIEMVNRKHVMGGEAASMPRQVIENYVFQKRLDIPSEWKVVKALPTLTDMQAIGVLDPNLRDLGTRKRKRSLTLVA